MPHIIRFTITKPADIRTCLDTCKAMSITPEDLARGAFFDAINQAISYINSKSRAAEETVESPIQGEESTLQQREKNHGSESVQPEPSGTTQETSTGEATPRAPLEASEGAPTDSGGDTNVVG